MSRVAAAWAALGAGCVPVAEKIPKTTNK